MEYFSDKELGRKESVNTEITESLWNGICALYEKYYNKEYFASSFPVNCPDGKGLAGTNQQNFFDALKGYVPNIDVPIKRISKTAPSKSCFFDEDIENAGKNKTKLDTYAVLDFIQFCHINVKAVRQIGLPHNYYGHCHYEVTIGGDGKKEFRDDINLLFSRNGVAFRLEPSGDVLRILSPELSELTTRRFQTSDTILTGLLREAIENIKRPQPDDHKRALERLWDAFERAKTLFGGDKSTSANKMVTSMSQGEPQFMQLFNDEAVALTKIGNNYHIRHFEKDRHDIIHPKHVDYLFHRMLAFLDIAINDLRTS